MKTPEEMAEEYLDQDKVACDAINHAAEYLVKDAFIAGYKAAQQQYATEKVTDDYIETASNEAKELIAEFGLKGDEDVLVKALVAAYCRGVDAVDGYLRNSLSAYRASVKNQQWISVKDRLPELEYGFAMRRESMCVLIVYNGNVHVAHLCEKWCDRTQLIFEACDCDCRGHDMEQDEWELDQVTDWMPLPAPPKEEE